MMGFYAAGAMGQGGGGGDLISYARLYITANNGNPYTALQQIAYRETPGGPSIAVGGVATASSYFGFDPPSDAFNGNIASVDGGWVPDSTTFPHWITYAFASPVNIVEMGLWVRNDEVTSGARGPKDFVLQFSNDNATWTDAGTYTNVTGWVIGTEKVFSVP